MFPVLIILLALPKFYINDTIYNYAIYLLNIDLSEEIKEDLDIKSKEDDTKTNSSLEYRNYSEFEKRLVVECTKFNNPVWEKVHDDIYKDLTGSSNFYTKMLLVLIDKIDISEYRNELIKRLCTKNRAAQTTFEHITGLKLPTTNEEIRRYIATRTKKDFTEPILYTHENQIKQLKEKIFQINNNGVFEDVIGYEYPNPYGLLLFTRYTDTQVIISEVTTGMKLAEGTSEIEASRILDDKITDKGIDTLKSVIEAQAKNPSSLSIIPIHSNSEEDEDESDDDENESDEE